MFGMNYQSQIKDPRFAFRKPSVFSKNVQDGFCSGMMRLRISDQKTSAQMIMTIAAIGIYRQFREYGNQKQTLAKDIGNRNVIRILIVGIQRKNGTGENIQNPVYFTVVRCPVSDSAYSQRRARR